MQEILNRQYFGNSVYEYLTAAVIIIITIAFIHIVKSIVVSRLKKKETVDDPTRHKFIIKSINRFLIPAVYLGALYLALESLSFGAKADKTIGVIYIIVVTWFLVRFVISLSDYLFRRYIERTQGESGSNRLKPLVGFLNLLIWIIGLIFLLDNLGFQISTIVAGLGISGIAVALAAQAVLGDLFSYFVIYFDKPFEIGDFVIFDGNMGAIEKIGIKTTRIRSISGEELVVSNSTLTGTILHNYKRMQRRRVVFKLGVTYQTPAEKLRYISTKVKEVIEKQPNTLFDRGHFQGFGNFSLDYEFVYYVLTSDYNVYMDTQQNINLEIYEDFEKQGIEFAYPTQTLFVNKEESEKEIKPGS